MVGNRRPSAPQARSPRPSQPPRSAGDVHRRGSDPLFECADRRSGDGAGGQGGVSLYGEWRKGEKKEQRARGSLGLLLPPPRRSVGHYTYIYIYIYMCVCVYFVLFPPQIRVTRGKNSSGTPLQRSMSLLSRTARDPGLKDTSADKVQKRTLEMGKPIQLPTKQLRRLLLLEGKEGNKE